MQNFNIKSSILDFFEYVTNFRVTLVKHFRGYRENISYSSKYFYNGSLQAIRLRSRPINEVIRFTEIAHDGKQDLLINTNSLEYKFILKELNKLSSMEAPPSVGIISPFRNQVSFITTELLKELNADELYQNLKLKVMTFDTCQGEERDYIFYSMVANPERDKLSSIFLKSLDDVDFEEGGQIRAQRLNVGFSRSKECMHFVHSKPLDEFKGSIRDALFHYRNELKKSKSLPDFSEVDPKSPMEANVLNWILQTKFYNDNSDNIEIKPQFPIGDYLRQLDPFYNHPKYKIDFLLIFHNELGDSVNIIIEYDGFEYHFTDYANVNELNYESFHNESDVERQKVLESYGYRFLRLNKFNTKVEPINYVSDKLYKLVKKKQKRIKPAS